jgi:hypothetical protein
VVGPVGGQQATCRRRRAAEARGLDTLRGDDASDARSIAESPRRMCKAAYGMSTHWQPLKGTKRHASSGLQKPLHEGASASPQGVAMHLHLPSAKLQC